MGVSILKVSSKWEKIEERRKLEEREEGWKKEREESWKKRYSQIESQIGRK